MLKFKTKPWSHQLKALRYLYKRDTAALYTDMGTGKTKVMIDLIYNRNFKRVLVVGTPKSCDVWEEQIAIHGFESKMECLNLKGLGMEKRIDLLKKFMQNKKLAKNEKIKIVLINYESVWRPPLDKYFMRKSVGFDCIICDESHKIKTPSSKCSKYLTKIGNTVKCKYLVTGTPIAENPMDVYAQYRFLDNSIFGTNFSNFKDQYQNVDVRRTAAVGYTVLDRKNPYKNLDQLREKMFSCAFYIESSVELPEQTFLQYNFNLPETVQGLYNEIQEEGVLELNGKFVETNNVLSLILKLQQITSGYLPIDPKYQDEYMEKPKVINIHKERVNALQELIESLPKGEPLVIFANYRKDLKNIRNLCKKLNLGYSEVSGKYDTLNEWRAGKTQIIGVQYSSGSESIDLTRARYCVYYSLTRKLALYTQSKKRIHRPGQTRPVVYYHFIAKIPNGKTIDEIMYDSLIAKKDVVDYIMERRNLND